MSSTEIAHRATIVELVGYRDRALRRADALAAEVKEINRLASNVSFKTWSSPSIQIEINRVGYTTEAYRKRLDAAAWGHLMERTEFRNMLGAKQHREWTDKLHDDPPEFTVDNAIATFTELVNNSGDIFRQSVVDVFERLNRSFRSHDGFKIGSRCIMEYAVTPSWGTGMRWQYSSYGYDKRAMLRDLDRAFHKLAEIEWKTKADDIAAKLMENGETECETKFFKMRFFLNGNMHVWMTDKPTTRKANKLLAEHYGPKLPNMMLHPDDRRETA